MLTTSPGTGHKAMTKQSHNGFRRLSPAMLAASRTAKNFTGLSEGEGGQGGILAAFKAAAPYLSLPCRVVHAVDWLFRFTRKQDWEPGSRPIVWPSAFMQVEALGIGLTQVKALNRYMVELGLVVMKDSPNGKRYGRRDKAGRIIEAYGFDLSPLAVRMAEFRAIAEQGREVREAIRQLHRRASVAGTALIQIAATAAEYGLLDPAWQTQATEARKLARKLTRDDRLDELAPGVAYLERLQNEEHCRLEALLSRPPISGVSMPSPVETDPKGPENRPHNTTTNQTADPSDTVIAQEKSKSLSVDGGRTGRHRAGWDGLDTVSMTATGQGKQQSAMRRPAKQQDWTDRARSTGDGAIMRITPDELVRMAPRLKPYLTGPSPKWSDIVEAADWLRHDLEISKPLWGEACLAMGREHAAMALAIVSTKPAGYFRNSPGGYFHGMVAKARAGELNLSRTIWGLRTQRTQPIRPPA